MHTSTMMRVPYGNFIRTVEIYRSLLTNSVNPPTVSFIHNVIRDVLVKIPARDEITSHVITIWPAWPLVSISENELNRHLRHLQLWNYTTSLFLALRQLSRTFNTHTDTVHQCACARANEYVKDCYYSSQYKLGAQYPLADVSIIHVHVLKYGGVGIASQLGEEEKDEGDERDGAGRAEASTASFITNLFHPVVEMGHCSLHATKATTSQSPSHDWCFHFSGVHHHRDKKCKPSTPTCKTQSLVESAFQEIGSRWVAEPD
ncbi:hypothetical protein G5I_02231 [Acromyrmex echinatior]|uniref:Uncharacterized protein n=1 Tax=Acromyrmex echinatior TaxID=103372 RepID=F4W9S4_ACREC|nr:hypothetical protein G5I_02231 [Acromyrmex echinatior]